MRRASGQTMVLAALTLLLLALMVMVTLSIGWRVRDRMEAQISADAAAYSQAVDLARVYNEIAVLNRVQISLLVASTTMMSLVSWSSHHYSNLVAAERVMGLISAEYASECSPFNPCPCTQIPGSLAALAEVSRERARVGSEWDGREEAATGQIETTWAAALSVSAAAQRALYDLLEDRVENQKLAKTLAGLVYGPGQADELEAPDDGDDKAGREISEALYDGDSDKKVVQTTMIALGTRGWDFSTRRAGRYAPIRDRLEPLVQRGNGAASVEPAAQEGTPNGGTTFGVGRHDNTVQRAQPGPLAWADDHGGTLTIDWPAACGKVRALPVQDTLLGSGPRRAQHTFTPGDGAPASRRHRLTTATNGKIFPDFLSFNFPEIAKPANDFGQPKLYTILDRDYRRTARKPWDLRFDFQFSEGAGVDLGAPDGRFQSPSGATLQHQTALASSIAYYHRPDEWREPPNFFNPFWRATLYAADDDVERSLRKAGFEQHAQTMKRLLRAGWEGTR